MARPTGFFRDLLLAALLGGAVAAAAVGLALAPCGAAASRVWKERSVAELLAPVDAQLRHTRRAFARGDRHTQREGNAAIRELLLSRSHLVPPELRGDADALVEHYDVWLEAEASGRGEDGPAGRIDIAFPSQAARRFSDAYARYRRELYGQ